MREVRLDGALPENECRCHFPVRPSFDDESRDPSLGRRQPNLPRAASHVTLLGPRSLRPPLGATLREDPGRLLDSLACGALLFQASPDHPERQQRSATTERIVGLVVQLDRILEQRDSSVDIASGSRHETSTAQCLREHDAAAEASGVCLPGVEDGDCLLHVSELE